MRTVPHVGYLYTQHGGARVTRAAAAQITGRRNFLAKHGAGDVGRVPALSRDGPGRLRARATGHGPWSRPRHGATAPRRRRRRAPSSDRVSPRSEVRAAATAIPASSRASWPPVGAEAGRESRARMRGEWGWVPAARHARRAPCGVAHGDPVPTRRPWRACTRSSSPKGFCRASARASSGASTAASHSRRIRSSSSPSPRAPSSGSSPGSGAVGALYRSFLLRDGVAASLSAPVRLLTALPRVLETLRHGRGDDDADGGELLSVAVDPRWSRPPRRADPGRGVPRPSSNAAGSMPRTSWWVPTTPPAVRHVPPGGVRAGAHLRDASGHGVGADADRRPAPRRGARPARFVTRLVGWAWPRSSPRSSSRPWPWPWHGAPASSTVPGRSSPSRRRSRTWAGWRCSSLRWWGWHSGTRS